ncbi:hypothetical protein V1520DRAFT_350983 [Lipomyces starkeyi]
MSYICLQQKPPYPTISPNFKKILPNAASGGSSAFCTSDVVNKRIKKENAVRVPVSLATTPTLHSAIEMSALHAAGHSRSMRNAGQVYYSSVTRATHLTEMGGLTVGMLSNRF